MHACMYSNSMSNGKDNNHDVDNSNDNDPLPPLVQSLALRPSPDTREQKAGRRTKHKHTKLTNDTQRRVMITIIIIIVKQLNDYSEVDGRAGGRAGRQHLRGGDPRLRGLAKHCRFVVLALRSFYY